MGKNRRAEKRRKKNKKNKGKSRTPKTPMAETADRYQLYLESVQAPDVDVAFFDRVYKEYFGEAATMLREDFCGTFAVCCEWAKLGDDRKSWGIDLDPEPLAWGREKHLAKLPEEAQTRVTLLEDDVLKASTPAVDVLAAQNFSYCIFDTRDALRDYFKRSYAAIKDQGAFVVDLFGGYESIEDDREEVTEHDDFDYVWDQSKYDPINARGTYFIHFRFHDGSEIENAFKYEWRLWTIPEVREIMAEAGFEQVDVFWEGTDPKSGEGTGEYNKRDEAECDPAWVAYIVGVKGKTITS